MKSVLISTSPENCELIASGKKTVEVRKTRPKLETPFKCYIYETKDKKFEYIGFHYANGRKDVIHHIGKVIGEYVCDKVVEFENSMYEPAFYETSVLSCVDFEELGLYLGGKEFGYSWHISDILIYDKPRELSEFRKPCVFKYDCGTCKHWSTKAYECLYDDEIKRPPQSWYYVEVLTI